KRQTLFVSATMPPEIQRLVDNFLTNPARIAVAPPATAAKAITQRFVFCRDAEDRATREQLRQLIRSQDVRNAIIFCNRKRDVAILNRSLLKHGFNAGALHGAMDQKHRMETLDKFRSGEITVLAASDVAARGLDIPEVSHVFNFDVPWAADDYVHRIGRTGRAGREGFAATLVTRDELKLVKQIEKVTGEQPIWLGEPPPEEDFAEATRSKRRRRRGGKAEDRKASATAARRPERDSPRPTNRAGRPAEAPWSPGSPAADGTATAPKKAETRAQPVKTQSTPPGVVPKAKEPQQEAASVGFADKIPAFLR